MGRKKKIVNNSVYPQHLIERFARCVIEDIRADFAMQKCKLILRVGWQLEKIRTEQPKAADLPSYATFFTNIIQTLSFGFYIKWI